ncbi:MAG: malto-oligosyltrehalose synthase, partial [Nakamurella sp.]
ETGAAKLLVTSRSLRARRDRPDAFTGYEPVQATGSAALHVLAFNRGGAVTVATRLPLGLAANGGFGSTTIALPSALWRDEFTGRTFGGASDGEDIVILDVGEILARYPVALLLLDS